MELREHPPLSREDVHVWTANLDQAKSVAQSFLSILAPDELIRAKKYSFAEHRERFVIARGVLRKLLGRYAGVGPEQAVADPLPGLGPPTRKRPTML